jgi:hypothetical protein
MQKQNRPKDSGRVETYAGPTPTVRDGYQIQSRLNPARPSAGTKSNLFRVSRRFRGSPLWSFDTRGTTKDTKDTKTIRRKRGPQISQISKDEFNQDGYFICENLRNLWINPFVNK